MSTPASAMKNWRETSLILEIIERLRSEGKNAALATVVRILGSAYRRPGAKLLVAEDGTMTGSVSGGCLEADVREVGLSVIRGDVPRLVHYDTGSDDATPWGLGLGCNGAVDVFVQLASDSRTVDLLATVRTLLAGDAAFAISTVIFGASDVGSAVVLGPDGIAGGSAGDASLERQLASCARESLGDRASRLYEFGSTQIFVDVQLPPPSVVILGAGEDARSLAFHTTEAGFRPTVVDHRAAFLEPRHFPAGTRLVSARAVDRTAELRLGPRTYAVVMTHSFVHDREWVKRLLATDVPYIGVLGSRERVAEILQQLGADSDERVFGPVGLDLGAEGPEQIALSIAAELLAFSSGRDPMHLRDRAGAIRAG